MKNTQEIFQRTALLVGSENIQRLASKTVAVFGLGGVGGFAVEALARCGIGKLVIVDNDTVNLTNINRQLFALHSTLDMKKTAVAKQRIADINPHCVVEEHDCFFNNDSVPQFDFEHYDFVVDAIDTVTSKLLLAQICQSYGTPLIACMSTGNKLDNTRFVVCDIKDTINCPLARVMRRELKKRGIEHLKVVCSNELPTKFEGEQAEIEVETTPGKRQTPSSISFVPSVAGLILAGEVVRELLKKEK